jgi:hypothetical protein
MPKRYDFINGKYKVHQDPFTSPEWKETHGCEIYDCLNCGKKVFEIKSIYGGMMVLDAFPEYEGRIFITGEKKAARIGFKSNRPMPRYRLHKCWKKHV